MTKRKLITISAILYIFLYMGDSLLTSYYSLYFIERGMNEMQQSILLGAIPLSLMAGCLIMSPLSRTKSRAMWLFRICIAFEIALSILLGFANTFEMLLTIIILTAFFNGAPFCFIEGYLVPIVKEKGGQFFSIRVFGTIGYILALVLGFVLLRYLPIADCYYYAAGFFVGALAISFLLKAKVSDESEELHKTKKELIQDAKKFWTKKLVGIMIAIFLVFGTFNASAYILPIHLSGLGISNSDYSLYRAISMMVEFLVMIFFPLLFRILGKNKTRILIASILCTISCLVGTFIANGIALAVVSFVFAGAGKAFFFGCLSTFLTDYCYDDNHLGKALSLNNASMNLSTTALNSVGLPIYDSLGAAAYFGIITGIEALGILIFVFTVFLTSKKEAKIAKIQ